MVESFFQIALLHSWRKIRDGDFRSARVKAAPANFLLQQGAQHSSKYFGKLFSAFRVALA